LKSVNLYPLPVNVFNNNKVIVNKMSQFIDLSSNEDTNHEDINERSIDMSSNDLNLFVEQTEDLVSDCDDSQPIGTNKRP